MDYAKGLLKVLKNIVDVLDAHAEPDHLRHHTGPFLFLSGHLAMGSGRRMAGQGLCVSKVHQPDD